MKSILDRLKKYAGLDKDKDRCPSNPCITVREAIELADHIELLTKQRNTLLVVLRAALVRLESDQLELEAEFGHGRSLQEIEKDGNLGLEIIAARQAIASIEGSQS